MRHITDLEIKQFHSQLMQPGEEMALLAHIAHCDFCAGRFASAFPDRNMLTPPPDLHGSILHAARNIPDRKQRQREFFRYSTKIVLAMSMALLLLLCGNFPADGMKNSSSPSVLSESDRQAYQESLLEQGREQRDDQEKFLQEKAKQQEEWKKKQENSGKLSSGLQEFSSKITKYLRNQHETKPKNPTPKDGSNEL